MKIQIPNHFLVFGLLGFATSLFGQGKTPQDHVRSTPPDYPDNHKRNQIRKKKEPGTAPYQDEHERLSMLKRLLEMPPDRLSTLKATISRIENLSPEEKKRLAQRLENFGRMPPHEQRKLHENFRADERKRWDAFHLRHKDLPPEQRNRELQRVHSLPPHERRIYFEKLRHKNHPHGGHHRPPPAPHRKWRALGPHHPQLKP
ncbi:MAG: DUF3106 domain-containing protein [Opitutales bacterium]